MQLDLLRIWNQNSRNPPPSYFPATKSRKSHSLLTMYLNASRITSLCRIFTPLSSRCLCTSFIFLVVSDSTLCVVYSTILPYVYLGAGYLNIPKPNRKIGDKMDFKLRDDITTKDVLRFVGLVLGLLLWALFVFKYIV